MRKPNTLIFVDFPSPDPDATGRFYAEVFGWTSEPRPSGVFSRLVPGGFFENPDGEDSEVGNLHMGVFSTELAPPDPNDPPAQTGPTSGPAPRVYILTGDDTQDEILDRAAARGATILWRDKFWAEFNGFHGAFRDPWGTEIILWSKGGENPVITAEQGDWQKRKGWPDA